MLYHIYYTSHTHTLHLTYHILYILQTYHYTLTWKEKNVPQKMILKYIPIINNNT